MKKSIMLISLLLIIGLSACGNNTVQSSYLEDDSYIAAPDEAPAQEETAYQTEEPASTPVLVSEERVDVPEDLPRYTLRQALYKGGEEIVVHWDATLFRRGDMRTYSDGSEIFQLVGVIGRNGIITIENSAGDTILRIEYPIDVCRIFDENHATWLSSYPNSRFFDSPPLQFADLNFDGYLDLVISIFHGAMAVPVNYYGFIWYPELGRFVEAESFSQIFNFRVDEERQVLRSSYRRGPSQIWRYIDGDFVVTNELMFCGTGNPYHMGDDRYGELRGNYFIDTDGFPTVIQWETHLVNGEMVPVWPIISDTEEGRAIIYEHLFGEDSIWFPGQ